MSDNKNISPPERGQSVNVDSNLVSSSDVSSIAGSVKTYMTSRQKSSSSERQIKFERAQKCLENAALVSKRIKEHRKATAELLGRPFEEDDGGDTASELASTMSEKTGYSAATDTSTTLSVQDALNIPGISESLANTLKQKELLMERIKQYKEISKRPMTKASISKVKRDSIVETKIEPKQTADAVDINHLLHTLKEKENSLSVIQVKMKAMESTILDLQEKINEKDQIIEAKNKATSLMSDSLSKKEKDSLDLLEDTRQQMTKMQENFIAMETEWKEEKQKLIQDIELKEEKIKSLEEANSILETSRFEISVAHSKLIEEIDAKNKEIKSLQEKINSSTHPPIEEPSLKKKDEFEEEKGSLEIAGMVELTKKIELLEQINCQIRQTNKELENKLAVVNIERKSPSASTAGKRGSPLPTRKGGRNTASKSKSPWSQLSSESLPQETDKKAAKAEITRLEMLVQSLNKDILEKEYTISQKEAMIAELQTTPANPEVKDVPDMVEIGTCTNVLGDIKDMEHIVETKSEQEQENNSSQSVTSHNVKVLEEKLHDAERKIESLQKDIEVANLNMIKVKSAHKLKVKQLQKTIDSFSKVSDAHTEVVRLQQELQDLTRKVAILEEEKGNLQLHLVDYDSGRLTESDMYKKMRETETLSETRLKAISVLESQKFDLVQELHILQQKNAEMEDKLADISQLQSEHVCSEMKSVEMEEQIDELTAAKKELELVIENLKLDKEHLNEAIKGLQNEKIELTNKLENYIQENIELTDKLEKLTAEKVSSAESIEIVESLTTQEKLELEEYNKGIFETKSDDHSEGQTDRTATLQNDKNIDSLIEQREELNKKIEILMQEKEEVMETIAKITNENQALLTNITELKDHNGVLINSIETLDREKQELLKLNQELIKQVDELKNERIEIMKESVEIAKPMAEDATDGVLVEVQHDDKATNDKGAKGAKTVKQLTKEILKLKNIIKEREDEIADCQMKILSLEEQQQKQNELLQTNVVNENKIKSLTEEIRQMKQDFENTKKDKESEQNLIQLKQSYELLQQELRKVHQEYSISVSSRDARITELENVLLEYEKRMFNYSNSLQQKDKELAEYINQITKLNDVSQKLRSTIDLLEEEKAKDQNAELVKNLNKQMAIYQKKLLDNEEKINILEDEKMKLHCLKGELMSKNVNIETELKKMKEIYNEKQILIKELQAQHQKHAEEMVAKQIETTERDEEIHEIKLQLRKESIENEKLRNNISEKENIVENLTRQLEDFKEQFNQQSLQTNCSSEQYSALETKNRELMEKLKKLAIGIKKKAAMNSELEANHEQIKKQLAAKSEQVEQLLIQVETLPALQEKFKHADDEIKRLQSHKAAIEQQRIQDLNNFQVEIKDLQDRFLLSSQEVSQLNESLTVLHKDLNLAREENLQLKAQVDVLNKKIVELEIEQRNNINLSTKISSLEADINQKQIQISELLGRVEYQEQHHTQVQHGYDAKVQERDLYIENLETEIDKYKSRICRLEESISIMEDRRHSLERKADQLGSDLEEKQKAYTEYASQEDELVTRLAALMDHDRVLAKQLHEIDNENKELQFKVQHLSEDNQRLRKSYSDIQENYTIALEKANKFESKESEISKYQGQLRDLETNLKKVTHDYQSLIIIKKQEIEELEIEFNTQIENAIKEKKTINDKYEKLNEYVSQLENKLHEYKSNIESLNASIAELNKLNQELSQKASNTEQIVTPDYTEQYISEINRLNSVISSKSNEIDELHNKIQSQQTNNVTITSNFDSKISDLTSKLNQTYTEIQSLTKETTSLRIVNEQLQNELSKKDILIRELMDKNKLQFEMNIPKTEGMVITSTIEPLSGGAGLGDISSLESQIVSNVEELLVEKRRDIKKVKKESLLKQTEGGTGVEEPLISAKKAYVCYTKEDERNTSTETDPFNSDEGWGLGESEEIGDITPGLSHLNSQIEELKKDNAALKADIQTNNVKLLKAVKKLKELKACNEVLTNELKTARQTSQTSFFDNAIDDELRENIKLLEKKIEELNEEILKEKRDKESLRKQNEVFHNANDRLTEIKEKLDSEIQLWKYKFKEANDKVSTLQWGGDNKDATDLQTPRIGNMDESKLKEEINKIEKENEELHSMVDQVNARNQELLSKQTILENEIANLNNQLQQVNVTCVNCEHLKSLIDELRNIDVELKNKNSILSEKLQNLESQFTELSRNYEILKGEYEEMNIALQNEKAESLHKNNKLNEIIVELNKMKNDQLQILNKNRILEEELIKFKQSESDKLELLNKQTELEDVLLKFDSEKTALLEHNNQLSEELLKLNQCESEKTELLNVKSNLEEQLMELKQLYSAANEQISCLATELDLAEAKILSHNERPSNNIEISAGLVLSEKCNALEEHIANLKLSLDEANAKVSHLESENQKIVLTNKDYQEEINQLNIKIQQLNGENDNLLSTVAELRSSVSSAVDQRGFEIAELWKQHLGQREADFQKIETDLRTQLNAAETKYEQLLENVQSSNQEETNKLVIMEQVNSLQNKLEDKEEHLRNLQIKYAETMHELDMLCSEMEDEKVRHENKLLEQQEEYERMIQEAAVKNEKQSEAYEERFKNIQNELLSYKTKNEDFNQIVENLQAELNETKARVIEVTNQLMLKDSEIYQKTHDYTITLTQRNEEFENVRKQLIDYEKKIEELSYEKEAELAVMRLKIHEKDKFYDTTKNEASAEKAKLMEALNGKIVECTNLNKQIVDLNQQLQDHSVKAAEMESALENQEIEIVTLKDEIVALQNAMRSASGKIQKHVSFSSDTKIGSDIERTELYMNKDLLDAVPRAELDLALYMLHQRDVRCEELTMELTQLLEERDTLQLRLSDSLRLNEDLKKQCKTSLEESIYNQETIAVLPSFSVEKEFIDVHRGQSSRSSSMSDIDGEKPKLQAKLSELRTVKHSRDVRLRNESEQRQLDLRLLQQDVANLPPEAVDQLAQAHHTLSRDSQSTSTVLLNWLRGKSTPKVVHM